MSTEISISGVHDLPDLSGVDAVISIRDPGDERPEELQHLDVPVFDLVFHDVGHEPDELDISPEAWHLEQLQRFLGQAHPNRVHVHCFYGVSRSTAVASLVLATQDERLTDKAIVQRVLQARPQAHPNRTLLSLIDDLLGRDLTGAWARHTERY